MNPIKTSIAVIALALATSGDAAASPSCMTKQEARAAYPRAHLYWVGSGRCWTDRRGRSTARRQYRAPVNDEVEMPKPLPPAPAIIAPEPEPSIVPPLRTAEAMVKTEATATVGQYETERWRGLDQRRIALEQYAAKLVPPLAYAAPVLAEEPVQPEPEYHLMARWMLTVAAFIAVAVGGGMLSRRYMPRLMEGT